MQGGIQEDNGEFEHLHPLENPWTFWYDKPVRKNVRNWEQNIHQISKCITVEDFWRYIFWLKTHTLSKDRYLPYN